jgi:hypothetical protein
MVEADCRTVSVGNAVHAELGARRDLGRPTAVPPHDHGDETFIRSHFD